MKPVFVIAALLFIGSASSPQGIEGIDYEIEAGGNCLSPCTEARLSAERNGDVRLETRRWSRQSSAPEIDVRRWHVSPAQYAAFRARLAPYRPQGTREMNDGRECKAYASHYPSIIVNWRGGGADARLHLDLSCEFDNREEMVEALQGAPALLGLERMPGG